MAKRAFLTITAALVVCLGLGLYIGLYLTKAPGSAVAAPSPSGGVNLYLATVPAAEPTDPNPDWVSYYETNAQGTNWQHDTTFQVPANTLVHVTIFQYDGASGLRNEFLAQGRGMIGGKFGDNGKLISSIPNTSTSHIFAIPQIGLSVPLQGVSANAKNPCGNAVCTLKQDHNTITFTFRTPAKGLYRWQCFVPCAAGFIQGWGGPMQTVGYMDGFLKVV